MSNISGDKTENCLNSADYWIIKLDSAGNIEWQNSIGGSSVDDLITISQTTDGGYICGGNSWSDISGDKTENNMGMTATHDYWIIKLDVFGNIQWQNTIGGIFDDELYSISQTADGGYICGGGSKSGISGDKTESSYGDYDYWVVKLDASGSILWQKTIGGSSWDVLRSIVPTTDEGYICGGQSYSNIGWDKTEDCIGLSDLWIVKLDSSGDIQWQNTIGGDNDDWLFYNTVSQTIDGGYICGASSKSNISGDKTENSLGGWDYWVIKLNQVGNIEWQNTIGGGNNDLLWCISQSSDSGYFCGGSSTSNISGDKTENSLGSSDYWVVKLNVSNSIEWQNTIGGNRSDAFSFMAQTIDNGYICGGSSSSSISGDKTEGNWDPTLLTHDYWILKLFPDTVTGIPDLESSNKILVYPNPFTTRAYISFINNNEKFHFTLCDISGRTIETVSTNNNEIIITKEGKQPGIYLYILINENTREKWMGKIIIGN